LCFKAFDEVHIDTAQLEICIEGEAIVLKPLGYLIQSYNLPPTLLTTRKTDIIQELWRIRYYYRNLNLSSLSDGILDNIMAKFYHLVSGITTMTTGTLFNVTGSNLIEKGIVGPVISTSKYKAGIIDELSETLNIYMPFYLILEISASVRISPL